MRALYSTPVAGSPTKFEVMVTERPQPAAPPPPGHAIVKIHASGINPSDAANATVNLFQSKKPIIPGRDFAGVVVDSASPLFRTGTPVFGSSGDLLSFTMDGTAAEYVLVPEELLVRKPTKLSYAQTGAMGVPYACALETLQNVHLQRGVEAVLVLGATGAVGRAVVDICRTWGNLVVTASRGETTNVNVTADPELNAVSKALGDSSLSVIVDCVGSPALTQAALRILGSRGRYAVLAAGKGDGLEAKLNLLSTYRLAHTIVGINSIDHTPQYIASLLQKVASMVEHDGLKGPNEEELYKITLQQAPEAYKEAFKFTGKKHVICFEEH